MAEPAPPIRKLLVANRGEIAIRVFRAATELEIATVAVHTRADIGSLHRSKADESYEIGAPEHPLRPYLDIETIVRAALACGADAVHPGYGFLSESAALARACAEASLTFVGPTPDVLELAASKVAARGAAQAAGVPVLAQSPALSDTDDAVGWGGEIGFPLFVKAVSGGGGRGMRRVEHAEDLHGAFEAARREAESAFGEDAVFLEEALSGIRHIEAQVLGDSTGDAIHLFERDCSVQRRFQKVIESAPARDLDEAVRRRMLGDAVAFARSIGYENAGTVEFLLDRSGRYVFIEMNPRIQVEHTITEEITGVDIVAAQLCLAGGATLAGLGLRQENVRVDGFAIQTRVTAEDPRNDFRPDTGRVRVYRTPGGAGVRVDDAVYVGAEVTPYFDSLLAKVTCRGPDFDTARRRAVRAIAELRVRGLATNRSFVRAVLNDPDFCAGAVSTDFVDTHPHLTTMARSADRATRLLTFLADVSLNRPNGPVPAVADPATKLPPLAPGPPPAGTRQRLAELGPEGFARWMREATEVLVTDTTLRDAHQSILATRVRTIDLVAGARRHAHGLPNLLSLECWGGATFDVALRFLHEDPWERLERISAAVPNVCLQMLLRGRNTVGYSPYPDVVCERFVAEARRGGVDIFRIFDALNDVGRMLPAIRATREAGGLVEGTLCYSGDLADPGEGLYTLDYYLRLAEELVAAGSHVLAVKDMAGLLRAPAATRLVAALRERFEAPVHLHTHDTAGGQIGTYLAAIEAGVDAIDGAVPSLAGMTSQPSLGAIVALTDGGPRQTGLSAAAISRLEPYWELVRRLNAPFEAGLLSPTNAVYHHEIPGGQLSNLRFQAAALGVADRFEEVAEMYAACNRILGRPPKVTPSSKVVGDLALHLVSTGTTPRQLEEHPTEVDLPASVVSYLQGALGVPPGGFPEPFRSAALEGRPDAAPAPALTPAQEQQLDSPDARGTLSALLFPEPARSQAAMRDRHGDLSVLGTREFWYGLEEGAGDVLVELGPGQRISVGIEAIGEADESGFSSVIFRLNGELRPISARRRDSALPTTGAEQADPSEPGHVGAPFRGVAELYVAAGESVAKGQALATIEAMKMETRVTAPVGGTVARVCIEGSAAVEAGDLLAEIVPGGPAPGVGDEGSSGS
ncbi:MAG: pyruvate carboxylase [bacterium]|nr:pyruvate carboxylase [bacterium]